MPVKMVRKNTVSRWDQPSLENRAVWDEPAKQTNDFDGRAFNGNFWPLAVPIALAVIAVGTLFVKILAAGIAAL